MLTVLSAFCVSAASEVSVSASAFVLYCADNAQVLLASNEHTKMGMASTTKIMTALLTLEEAEKKDRVVEFTSDMTAEGSSMYLKKGDKVRLSDLASGMMTVSGNDAANAAAISIGGSYEEFACLMNNRAKAIGMNNTSFVTPSGLDSENHYSTAYDMALLMAEALKNEAFAELTSKSSVTVDFVYPSEQQVTYYNHNRLLKDYEYCTGGKTGYTKSCGRCLVTSAECDGLTLIAVTLNDRNDWSDHKALYEYGFSHYKAVGTEDETNSYKVAVAGSESEFVNAYTADNSKAVVPADRAKDIECRVYLQPVVFAPVKKGDKLGSVMYTLESEVILEKEIICAENVPVLKVNKFLRFIYQIFLN